LASQPLPRLPSFASDARHLKDLPICRSYFLFEMLVMSFSVGSCLSLMFFSHLQIYAQRAQSNFLLHFNYSLISYIDVLQWSHYNPQTRDHPFAYFLPLHSLCTTLSLIKCMQSGNPEEVCGRSGISWPSNFSAVNFFYNCC